MVRDAQGRPMATACLSSFVIGGASLAQGTAGKILAILERIVPWAIRSKLILCGLPVSAGQSHIRFAPEADREAVLCDCRWGRPQVREKGMGPPDRFQGDRPGWLPRSRAAPIERLPAGRQLSDEQDPPRIPRLRRLPVAGRLEKTDHGPPQPEEVHQERLARRRPARPRSGRRALYR